MDESDERDGSHRDAFAAHPTGPWRVLKFGGSSLAAPESMRAAAAIVRTSRMPRGARRPARIAVVVSALGGATDALAALVVAALAGDGRFFDGWRELRDRHLQQLERVARGPAALAAAAAIEDRLLAARRRLETMARFGQAPSRSRAAVLAAGERACAPLFVAALDAVGVPAETLDAAAIVAVDGPAEDGAPDLDRTRERTASLRRAAGGRLPVVPGFFGADRDGRLCLLGRGGSDTSATLLGAALAAERVEIWTDVDGVYADDPRRTARGASSRGTRPFAVLGYDDAERLAAGGAKVLHVKSIAPARAAGVPIVVRNTFRPLARGTWIGEAAPARAALPDRTEVAR